MLSNFIGNVFGPVPCEHGQEPSTRGLLDSSEDDWSIDVQQGTIDDLFEARVS